MFVQTASGADTRRSEVQVFVCPVVSGLPVSHVFRSLRQLWWVADHNHWLSLFLSPKARPEGSLRLHPILRSQKASRTSLQLGPNLPGHRRLLSRTFPNSALPFASPCRGATLCKVLQIRKRATCVLRVPQRADFAAPRSCSPAAAAPLLLLLKPMTTPSPGATFTFSSFGFFETFGPTASSHVALSTRVLHSLLCPPSPPSRGWQRNTCPRDCVLHPDRRVLSLAVPWHPLHTREKLDVPSTLVQFELDRLSRLHTVWRGGESFPP